MRVQCKNRNCDIADSAHVVAGNFAISSQASGVLILELSATTFAESRVVNQLFFARCCLGKVPGGAPFSQLHKGDRHNREDRPYLHSYKKQIQKQISGSNKLPIRGREDGTDARAVRSNSLARRIE